MARQPSRNGAGSSSIAVQHPRRRARLLASREEPRIEAASRARLNSPARPERAANVRELPSTHVRPSHRDPRTDRHGEPASLSIDDLAFALVNARAELEADLADSTHDVERAANSTGGAVGLRAHRAPT